MRKPGLLSVILLFSHLCTTGSVITDSTFIYHQILNGIQQAGFIFEGEVVAVQSYWNEEENFIYTSNTVKVFQSWKDGEIAVQEDQYVEVITRGGTVGNTSLYISHQIGFTRGQKGLFLCKPAVYPANPNSTVSSAYQFQLYDGLYFDYDYSDQYLSASYASINFDCVDMLYEILDTSYVANCFEVEPNGLLLSANYSDYLQDYDDKTSYISGTSQYELTCSIENVKSTEQNNKAYLEFDMFLKTNVDTNIYFDNALFKFEYDTAAFGGAIISNNKVSLQRGTVIAQVNTYNPPSGSNAAYNQMNVGIGAPPGAQNRYKLGTTPKKLFHAKIEVKRCDTLATIDYINHATMASQAHYSTNPNSSVINNYDTIYFDNPVSETVCEMNITGFSPAQVNGGTGDIVTIQGNYFGSSMGTVEMKNADNGGATWVTLDSYDITKWTTKEIKIRVPSTLPINVTNPNQYRVPGSGKIRITNTNGDTKVTDQEVNVEYSWSNDTRPNTQKGKIFFAGVDSVYDEDGQDQDLGYSFILNPNIASNGSAVGCIRQAMNAWVCETNVRWQIDDSVAVLSESWDKKSMIRFGQTGASNIQAETKVWHEVCDDPHGNPLPFVEDIDITISNAANHQWFYDSTALQSQPAGYYDFYSVILHELGHGHLHKHVNQEDDPMYYESKYDPNNTIAWNNRKSLLSTANVDGGVDIVMESQNTDFSNCNDHDYPIVPLPKDNCSGPSTFVKLKQEMGFDPLTVTPNPFGESTAITFSLHRVEYVSLKVFDLQGNVVLFIPRRIMETGKNILNVQGNRLPKGMYIAVLQIGSKRYMKKLVKS